MRTVFGFYVLYWSATISLEAENYDACMSHTPHVTSGDSCFMILDPGTYRRASDAQIACCPGYLPVVTTLDLAIELGETLVQGYPPAWVSLFQKTDSAGVDENWEWHFPNGTRIPLNSDLWYAAPRDCDGTESGKCNAGYLHSSGRVYDAAFTNSYKTLCEYHSTFALSCASCPQQQDPSAEFMYNPAFPGTPKPHGTEITITCNNDFAPPTQTASCSLGDIWDPTIIPCEPTCNENLTVLNGDVTYSPPESFVGASEAPAKRQLQGATASLTCHQNYAPEGQNTFSTCQTDGVWSPSSLPVCSPQEIICEPPAQLETLSKHALVSPNPVPEFFLNNEQITIACDPASLYEPTEPGATVITCVGQNEWDALPSDCIPKPGFQTIIDDYTEDLEFKNGTDPTAASAIASDALTFIMSLLSYEKRMELSWKFWEAFELCTYEETHCIPGEDVITSNHPALGNCFTFNHHNSSFKSIAQRAGEGYGLKVSFAIHQEENVPWSMFAGIRVFIHEPNELVFPESVGIHASPGFFTSIALSYNHFSRLGGNYGECLNYASDKDSYFYPKNMAFSKEACILACLQNQLNSACGCAHPNYPKGENMEYCQISQWKFARDFLSEKGDPSRWPDCSCPMPCKTTAYNPSISTGQFAKNPAACGNFSTDSGNYSDCASEQTNEKVRIHVYFQRMASLLFIEKPAYGTESVLSDLGGILGILCGMSVLSLAEMVLMVVRVLFAAITGTHLTGFRRVLEEEEDDDDDGVVHSWLYLRYLMSRGRRDSHSSQVYRLDRLDSLRMPMDDDSD